MNPQIYKTSVVAMVLVGSLCSTLNGVADERPVCDAREVRATSYSLEELVKNAEFIGYYIARGAEPLPTTIGKNDGVVHRYTLYKQWGLTGDAPVNLTIEGQVPYAEIPMHYLATTHRHSRITPNDPNNLGSTPYLATTDPKECRFLPRMTLGANYLILGGVDSHVSFEIILDVRVDDWYKMVSDEVKKQKAALEKH